ncbi:uncharacterized protein LOC126825069 isoform X2 [Patella vulgata]|uniref:uncharacterized protein LOC126825069 isoform X2 n=1 Tax=Patella vulgata TaxID=6465 RepID=UPI0024A93C2A|nr:uncharacterized protein LOC126825069 isoform X2 [Patella vulgata]
MISKMTALIVVCMTITSILVLGTQGEISITSEPEKIVYNDYFTLTCHIGTVTDEVKWINNGITYFSCISPYSAGLCFINTTAPYYYATYDVNITAGISTIRMYARENRLEGLWTCHHGRDSSTYNVNPVDYEKRAYITSFTSSSSSNINVGTVITLTCNVSNTTLLPVNVSISSQNREGNLTYVTKSSSRIITASTRIQCTDHRFLCTVYNGYGTVYIRNAYYNVKCPVNLLRDKTTSTVNATFGSYAYLRAYYSGYPRPSYTWYRRSSQVEVKLYNYGSRASWSDVGGQNRNIYLQINKVRLQDAGQYSVHINDTGKVFIVVFTLNVNPAPTSNSIAEEQNSETQIVDALQHNCTNKAADLNPSTTQSFISAAGLGIGIAVGVIITLLVQGVVLLVTRTLKSRDVKDKDVKTKSTNKGRDKIKNKNKQSDYDNTAYIPSVDDLYENLEDEPNPSA